MTTAETNWRRLFRRLALVGLDAVLAALAFALAYVLRLDFTDPLNRVYVGQCLKLVGWVAALHAAFFLVFQLYRGVTRFAGLRETLAIAAAATVCALLLIPFNILWNERIQAGNAAGPRMPWSIIPLTWMLVISLTGGARYLRRLYAEGRLSPRPPGRGVLIIGAGTRGERVARELMIRRKSGRRPVGFIDDNPELRGRSIHGIRILGGMESIEEALKTTGAQEIIVALPSPSPRQMKEIADRCGHSHVAIQRLPSVDEMLDGQVALERVRPVRIEDLLTRPPARLDLDEKDNYLRGRRVLVTGAGGSIGSELCRQVLRCGPQWLGLMGHGENSLYEIVAELRSAVVEVILADIQNERKTRQVFERWQPEVVFHAAAHKHVQFGESAPDEVVRNNVFGTRYAARAAIESGVERFILVSTDKALRPVGVMGASKRVAEMLCASADSLGKTEFVAVRFGNVLGSRGSVVPLFLRQIQAGGPVTVTDREMTRYFMTIGEAVSLVLQAGAIGRRGQLLALDMGQPVRIDELARNLITLAGFEPDADIAIEYTGARPGEKTHEELITAEAGWEKTAHEKIYAIPSAPPDPKWLDRELDVLLEIVEDGNVDAVRNAIRRLADWNGGS